MLILLLLYLASHCWAKDVPLDTNYKFTNITSCPESGYFFQSVSSPNSIDGDCYLCFCHDETSAICWQRENKKCDAEHYKHNTVNRKENRVKRSPLGLSDIFFKDAARENSELEKNSKNSTCITCSSSDDEDIVFNKKEEEVCKPYESSFSDGCPPPDWCIGCTVCDCDANGHWDCHILSFCDDEKKGKDHKKVNKKLAVRFPKPKKATTAKIAKTTNKTPVRSVKTSTKTTTMKPKLKARKANYEKKNNDKNKPTMSRSIIQKGKPVKPLIIKKNDKNPKVVKTSPSKRVMNGTEAQMSEAIMNTMKVVMQQMLNKQVTEALPSIVSMIQKRSFPGRYEAPKATSSNVKRNAKPKSQGNRGHVYNKSLFIRKAAIEEKKKEKLRRKVLAEKAARAKQNKAKKNKRIKRDTVYSINKKSGSEVHSNNSQNMPKHIMKMPEYKTSTDNFNATSSIDLGMKPKTNITNATHVSSETLPFDRSIMMDISKNTSKNNNIATSNDSANMKLGVSKNITNMNTVSNKFKQTVSTAVRTASRSTGRDDNMMMSSANVSTEIPSTRNISGTLNSSYSEVIDNESEDIHDFVDINKSLETPFTKISVDEYIVKDTVTNSSPLPKLGAVTNTTYKPMSSYQPTTNKPVSIISYPSRTIDSLVSITPNRSTTVQPFVSRTSDPSKTIKPNNSNISTTKSLVNINYTTTTIKPSLSTTSYRPTTIKPRISAAYKPTMTVKIPSSNSSYPTVKTQTEFYNRSDPVTINKSLVYNSSDILPVIVPLIYNNSFASPLYTYEPPTTVKLPVSNSHKSSASSMTNNNSATILPLSTIRPEYQSSDSNTTGSTNKHIGTSDTFSRPYIKSDIPKKSKKIHSNIKDNERFNYNVIAMESNATSITQNSEITTESSSRQLTTKPINHKLADEENYYAVLPATTRAVTVSDSDVSNSSDFQSTAKIPSTKSSNNSVDKLRIPVINNMFANKKYYEYTVNSTIEKPTTNIEKGYNRTESKVVIGITPNENKIDRKTEFYSVELPNDSENEIKSTIRSGAKPFGQKKTKASQTNNTDDMIIKNNNETKSWQKKGPRRKINRNEIERKVEKPIKKYTLTRVTNSNLNKNKRGGGIKESDSQGLLSSKIETLRNVLKRLLSEFHNNSTKPNENKKKKTNAIKYLKRFFNKLFYKDSNKTIISQRLRNNNHTIQMLCETFGPCIIYKKDMVHVAKKLKELNNETLQILKSLRIIKGLLRLLDIPNSNKKNPAESSHFRNDIHKLNVILNSDVNNEPLKKLSETQRIQIDYIKSNTKVFKQSVARFTNILNQIIELVSIKASKEKQRMWIGGKVRNTKRSSTKIDMMKKFKQLLRNYNTIHNAFVSKLIKIFSGLLDPKKLRNKNETANFINAEYETEKIVNNFNKLRTLESALGASGKRHKRDTMRQENSMEYLLMLMEYMLHQNSPTPVKDGIDLLIEAIKNAPDIKTIKKITSANDNYRKYAGVDINKADSRSDNDVYNDNSMSVKNDNSSSVSQDTEEGENEYDSNVQKVNEKLENENAERDDNDSNNKVSNETTEKIERTENKIIKQNLTQTTVKQPEVMENNDYVLTAEKPKNVYMGDTNNIVDFDSRLQKTSGDFRKNNKLPEYIPEFEDENVDEITNVTDLAVKNTKSLISVKQDEAEKTESDLNANNDKLDYFNNTSIKWIEEKEDFDYVPGNNNYNISDEVSPTITKTVTDKQTENARQADNIRPTDKPIQADRKILKRIEAVSDLSKESDEKYTAKVKKAEDVMKKKEEDFMNSLDYGTEPSAVEDFKEEKADDKMLTDYFA